VISVLRSTRQKIKCKTCQPEGRRYTIKTISTQSRANPQLR
jgi:hypothetical protein